MVYAHKSYVVNTVVLKEDIILYTCEQPQYGKVGDYLVTDQHGEKRIIHKLEFERDYIEVEKKSERIDLMKIGYLEMANTNLEEANAGNHTYTEGWFTDKAF